MNGNGEDDENSPDKGKIEFPDGASVQLDAQGKGSLRIIATHYWSANLDGHGTDTSWLTMEPMSAEEGGSTPCSSRLMASPPTASPVAWR